MNTISKRAQDLLEKKAFFKNELSETFEVSLGAGDKILTVFHGNKKNNLIFIFSEALSLFSKNFYAHEIWKINFREIENYLRDDNDLLAFPNVKKEELEEVFEEIKLSLIAKIIEEKLANNLQPLQATLNKWESLSLVAKNTWGMELFKNLGWDLVYCDKETLTVTNLQKGVGEKTAERLLNLILKREERGLPFKVVAVQ